MKPNTHVRHDLYRIVGEEVARHEFHPGPMARAVEEAHGNSDLIQSLYIKYRYEELLLQVEREEAVLPCPKCGYRGRPLRKPRGNAGLLFILGCFFILPGLMYGVAYSGYKGVCAKCGRTLVDTM